MSKSAQSRKKRNSLRKKSRSATPGSQSKKTIPGRVSKSSKADQKTPGGITPRFLGLFSAGILSLAIAIYIGLFVKGHFGLTQGVIWGALAGGSIWVAFFGSFWINQKLRSRK
jgi:hypothetical protein